MKKIFLIMMSLFLTFGISAQGINKEIELAGQKMSLSYKSDNAKLNLDIKKLEDGLEILVITLSKESNFVPGELVIKWATPSDNIAGYWSTRSYLDKTITPDWGPAKVKSMLSRHAPVMCLFGHDDVNQQTFAVSEAMNTVITSTSVREENGMINNEVKLFTEKHKELNYYEVQLRLDRRPVHYSESLEDISSWWADFELYTPAFVPEAAKLPVYSTWYSYHQNVVKDVLIEECKLAKTMGFESIIVDDGWQTLDGNRGYAYTGDWEAERIPEMKEFVQAVHDLEMKFILWYAVPFVGENSKAYVKLQGKFLTYWQGQGTYVVDPRFPEVREYIIDTYINAMQEWDLDGFKLDFLGRFSAEKDTRLVADEGRDYASVNEASDKLMTDLLTSLRAIKPDIMIEFRQPYTGPSMRKYGNMLRASDCPNVALINKVGITDLKILSGNTAVHADMLMWHHSEAVEVAALQLLNIIFSVPQISIRLADIPEDHFKMLSFYMDYWLENRAILLDGDFLPSAPLANYPCLSAQSEGKTITAIYNDYVIPFESGFDKAFDIINAKSSTRVIVDVKGKNQSYNYVIYNCKGDKVDQGSIDFTSGDVFAFDVPASGLISFIQ